jgi:hypothetical protein
MHGYRLFISHYKEFFMKKKALLSLVLLAIIGTSAVFAQAPTLDKLSFRSSSDGYTVSAANKQISGAVVIPDTYEGRPVFSIGGSAFSGTNISSITILGNNLINIQTGGINAPNISSITIPASVKSIAVSGLPPSLTSITFSGSSTNVHNGATGNGGLDLQRKYQAGGAGTYTRSGNIWTKQGGAVCTGGCPVHCP